MITFEQAYNLVMQNTFSLKHERVELTAATGRILAEDIYSDMDMPPFNKSAMDGYACHKEDLKDELEVIETIPAGKEPQKIINKGQCAKIMTGAMVPDGADCVIMVEYIQIIAKNKIRFSGQSTNINICFKGEDVKTGDLLINKGTLLKPAHIAIMASAGITAPLVSKQPGIGIISTGNELVEPFQTPSPWQIRNSNAYQLAAQVGTAGAVSKYYGIASDDENDTYNIIIKALNENDMVLLTGGVSMGDYDYVPAALKRAGIEIIFNSIAVQPGKPTMFGKKDKKFIFGLPGNPVSSFIQFEMFVKPLIYKMMAHEYSPVTVALPLEDDYRRNNATRKALLPVIITDKGTVAPVQYHGSAHIHAYIKADGIIYIPIGLFEIKKGELVNVRQI
ncbi:MAG: molybdopterin molybdotransferase MoeA [Bacteroidia bacterium]|nr:molybdopterin molybdotransferase MoeA [Bacteroidia bacterium]